MWTHIIKLVAFLCIASVGGLRCEVWREIGSSIMQSGKQHLLTTPKTTLQLQLTGEGSESLPPNLVEKLKLYLDMRKDDIVWGSDGKILSFNFTEAINQYNETIQAPGYKQQAKKEENSFMTMFKPAGWYKDTRRESIDKLLDSRPDPLVHPLSFPALKMYGFDYLSDEIISCGGAIIVGEKIGLVWKVPELPKRIVPDDQIPRSETNYALDMRGSLMLGGALEDRLAEAENLRLNDVKQTLQGKNVRDAIQQMDKNNSPWEIPDYRNGNNINSPIRSTVWKTEGREDKRRKILLARRNQLALSVTERLHLGLMSSATGLGWGRSSLELVHSDVAAIYDRIITAVDFMEVVSILLAVTSAASAIFCISLAKEKQLNIPVWMFRGLLGGPATVDVLKNIK